MAKQLSRRLFLQLGALGLGGVVAACAPQIVKETVIVEKAVEKEKIVEKTVVVEKEKVVTKEVVKEVAAKTAEDLLPKADKLGSPDKPKGWKTLLPDLPKAVPYKTPIVITCSRRVDAQTKFCSKEDLENNPWSRMIESLFNVKYKVAWTWSTGDEAQQKYNLALASGDLPEFCETMDQNVFMKAVEAKALEDITDAYDMYASPRWKSIWRSYGDLPWTWARVGGRIWGLPRVEQISHNDCVMWYRKDWLDKLGKPVPTTFDEVKEVALAFAKGDYGMGAKGSTIGLLASGGNDLYSTWYGSLDFFWGGHGYLPHQWQAEGKGLMYGATRPEVKEALGVLAQWYKDGVFKKDFFTKNASQSMGDVAANLCGFHFTPSWGANLDSVKNDPKAVWKFAEIPTGPKGFKRRYTENNFREGPFCFKKGFKNLEAIFTITEWWDLLWHDPWRRMHGWEGCNYEWDGTAVKSTGISFQNWIPGPVGTRGSGLIDPRQPADEIRYKLDEWGKIPADKRDAQQVLYLTDPTGVSMENARSRLLILETAGQGVMTKLQTTPTKTANAKGADLNKLRDQAFVNIIIGQQPLADWDKFVDQWKKAGGDDWTKEVNDWWATKSK
jgi:putative aldouronate transport system substrate-binding protein